MEHDNAITSCRSSLKAISEESPAIQLATRHCFILEDPPGDMKRFIVFLLIIAVSLDNTVAVCAVLFS